MLHFTFSSSVPCDLFLRSSQVVYEFNWSRNLQGIMLSAVYAGSLLGTVPGGWLADVYGGIYIVVLYSFVNFYFDYSFIQTLKKSN